MNKLAIIGAGPAGITLAYELSKTKLYDIEVFESSSEVGGMAKTILLWNQAVDIGPHRFFSNDKRVNDIWKDALDDDYSMVNRKTRIYFKKKFYDYPLRPINAFLNLGFLETTKCVFSFISAKLLHSSREDNFQDWVVSRFGKNLFNIFFKSYSEKLWGIKCTELDSDFAKQRIKKLSLYEAIKEALLKHRNKKHATLIDVFAYPNKGSGNTYIKMAEKAAKNGVSIHLNSPVNKIIQDSQNNAAGIELSNGEVFNFDIIVSSMPITKLINGLYNVPLNVLQSCSTLKFRNTIIVYLHIDGVDLFPDQWLYIHSKELKTGRITNFRNWVPTLYGKENSSILAMEYWCNDDDDIWNYDDELLKTLATTEIMQTGLIKDCAVLDGKTIRIPKCYPVYNIGYRDNLKVVQDFLDTTTNLFVIGRYGSFKYNNQDHSILMGHLMAKSLVDNDPRNLWEINTDYEYQEHSKIIETGLVN